MLIFKLISLIGSLPLGWLRIGVVRAWLMFRLFMGLRVVVRLPGFFNQLRPSRGLGFEVIYVNPINKEFVAEVSIISLRDELIKLAEEVLAQNALGRLTWLAFDAAN